jgi:hypothetical protein
MPDKNKRTTRKKSVAKTRKKSVAKRMAAKRKATRIRATSKSLARKKKFSAKTKRVTSTGMVVGASLPSVERIPSRDEEAGDLQGLSNRAVADSESVEELVEEGNALEAEAIEGVEDAPDADQGEVKTHEVPEDDPPEYLDKDR